MWSYMLFLSHELNFQTKQQSWQGKLLLSLGHPGKEQVLSPRRTALKGRASHGASSNQTGGSEMGFPKSLLQVCYFSDPACTISVTTVTCPSALQPLLEKF